ncbi:MAG: chromate transporter [Alphaproteobacteria bacterium]|nr:chromate transporter [Alphaproteobacteria bacterium]
MSAPGLFLAFARVGLFGFGGGPSMLPLMQQECVGNGFVTDEQFLEGLAVGNSLPGPIATKMALYVGWHDAGALGAAAALFGVLAPSSVLMGLLAGVLIQNRENPYVAGALKGVKPAIVGMLAFVAYDLAPTGITGWVGGILAVLAFAALVGKVHPGLVILVAAIFGALALRS